MAVYSPYFLILMFILFFLNCYFALKYTRVSTELKRMTKVAISPVISSVNEMVAGAATIRAYRKKDFIFNEFLKRNELLNVCHIHMILSMQWLRIRIEYSVFVLVVLAIVFMTINRDYKLAIAIDDSTLGLLLTYLLTLGHLCGQVMESIVNIMNDMSSVERIQEYNNQELVEADWDNPKAPENWIKELPSIKIRNLKARYHRNLPLVLKGIDIEFNPNEKIGIVGRTGSGKSTILLVL